MNGTKDESSQPTIPKSLEQGYQQKSDASTVLKKLFVQRKLDTNSSEDPILALENFKVGSYDLILLYQKGRNGWSSFILRQVRNRQQGHGTLVNS